MEASAGDIAFANGKFTVAGTDKSMPIREVAQMSFSPVGLPSDLGVGLQGAGAFSANVPSFPNGCHICEVEVDTETGAVSLDHYAVVDDVGTVVNPLLAQGQIHGGVVQGVGQAMVEDVVYDRDSGQLLCGSLMDYAVPRADMVPAIAVDFSPVPSKSNPLGIKGVGEGGTVAATPTVMNAIVDALAPLGVRHVAMPATPERIWRAIREAKQNSSTPVV
jgi:aerobic carbon-monoxide dehydrogenase large subunit